MLNKLTEVAFLGLIDFPCKVAFTEENPNPVYINQGPSIECEKLGYKKDSAKFKECVETMNAK